MQCADWHIASSLAIAVTEASTAANRIARNSGNTGKKSYMFDFLPVLLEDRKQRVLTDYTEAIEVAEIRLQKMCGPVNLITMALEQLATGQPYVCPASTALACASKNCLCLPIIISRESRQCT
jgi:hypothetical protein